MFTGYIQQLLSSGGRLSIYCNILGSIQLPATPLDTVFDTPGKSYYTDFRSNDSENKVGGSSHTVRYWVEFNDAPSHEILYLVPLDTIIIQTSAAATVRTRELSQWQNKIDGQSAIPNRMPDKSVNIDYTLPEALFDQNRYGRVY